MAVIDGNWKGRSMMRRKMQVGHRPLARMNHHARIAKPRKIPIREFISVNRLFKIPPQSSQDRRKCKPQMNHMQNSSELEALTATYSRTFFRTLNQAADMVLIIVKGKSQRLKKVINFKSHAAKFLKISSMHSALMARLAVKLPNTKRSLKQSTTVTPSVKAPNIMHNLEQSMKWRAIVRVFYAGVFASGA
jgi:hypothetical protein